MKTFLTKKEEKNKKKFKGFTLLELLLIVTIITILAGVVISTSLEGLARSRDARRSQELYQISHALQLYHSVYNYFPDTPDDDCSIYGINWDRSNKIIDPNDPFLQPLVKEGLLNAAPQEWKGGEIHGKSCVYRYAKVSNPCGCTGVYAILYASCESRYCPTDERPACCTNPKGYPDEVKPDGSDDPYDIAIFLKE